jgi:hypothetical protein
MKSVPWGVIYETCLVYFDHMIVIGRTFQDAVRNKNGINALVHTLVQYFASSYVTSDCDRTEKIFLGSH